VWGEDLGILSDTPISGTRHVLTFVGGVNQGALCLT
jgi:hypothetical protein